MTDPADLPPPQFTYAAPAAMDGELKALAICHYVWGGILMFFGIFPAIYVVLGMMMLFSPDTFQSGPNPPPPKVMGIMFTAMGGCGIVFGLATGLCTIFSGRAIAKRTRRTFSYIIAGVNCLAFPFGTTLAIFTFILLSKPAVTMQYAEVVAAGK